MENLNAINVYYNDIKAIPLLTSEEELVLAKKIADGDKDALNKLVMCNLRLVVKLANKYVNTYLPILDLIQEGNMGLMIAAEKFDYTKGVKFSSYASFWIKEKMNRAINNMGRVVRVSEGTHLDYLKYNKVKNILKGKLNREPKIEEIAQEMNISIIKAERLSKLNFNVLSLNEVTDDNIELISMVKNDTETPEDVYLQKEKIKMIHDMLNDDRLSDNEIKMILLKYGFINNQPISYQKIADFFGGSSQATEVKIKKCLKKLALSKNCKYLFEFINEPEALKMMKSFQIRSFKTGVSLEAKLALHNYFNLYNENDIKKMIKCLTPFEKDLLSFYGFDLENHFDVYANLIDKMENLLMDNKLVREKK